MLISLLVCLIPTTIGALLSAIGIAGIDRLVQRNVLAMSGRAVEAAGDVNTLLLDKTGTITIGNRQASEFVPVGDTTPAELAAAAQLSSLADETPEGRSVVTLAEQTYGPAARDAQMSFIEFSAQTRMSGVDIGDGGHRIRKGAAGSVMAWVREQAATSPTTRPRPSTPSAPAAGPRSLVAESVAGKPGCSASSTSRTWSSPACASGSTSCAPWGSAP